MSSKTLGEKAQKLRKRRKVEEMRKEPKEENSSNDSCTSEERCEERLDPFRSQKAFDEEAKTLPAREWIGACKGLSDEVYECAAELNEVQAEEFCRRCEKLILLAKTRASIQLKKTQRALQEYARRYLKALRDLNTEKEEKEEIAAKSLAVGTALEERTKRQAEENEAMEAEVHRLHAALATQAKEKRDLEEERDQLRAALTSRTEEKRELEAERDQLRTALDEREKRGEPHHTGPEMMELGEEAPSPPPRARSPYPRPLSRCWKSGWRRNGASWSSD